ncbi:MAG: hypothetical protein ACE5DI_02035 [Candidatus Micrarchaeia archaeon]
MTNTKYLKGANAERALKKTFEQKGFRVVRSGGSGTDGESPDLLVLSSTGNCALECKAWKSDYLHIEKTKAVTMREWERATSIPVFIAWKKDRKQWAFLPLSALRETPAAFVATSSDAACALFLEDLIKRLKTKRF